MRLGGQVHASQQLKEEILVDTDERDSTKTEFILPLANQVIEILKEVQQFTGTGIYVFPSFTKRCTFKIWCR